MVKLTDVPTRVMSYWLLAGNRHGARCLSTDNGLLAYWVGGPFITYNWKYGQLSMVKVPLFISSNTPSLENWFTGKFARGRELIYEIQYGQTQVWWVAGLCLMNSVRFLDPGANEQCFFSSNLICNPTESHIHGSWPTFLDSVLCYSSGHGIIKLNQWGWLVGGIPFLRKCEELFCLLLYCKESTKFCFSG